MTAGEKITRWVLGTVLGVVFIILYAPVIVVAVASLFDVRRGRVKWDSFDLESYWSMFDSDIIVESLLNTLLVGFTAVFCAIALASVLAVYVNSSTTKWRHALQFVIFLPFLLPPIVTGLAMLIFTREYGIPRGLVAVSMGHTAFVLALVYSTILNRLQQLNRNLFEASADLGANGWQTFRYVLLPQVRTAVIASGLLAFALSFDETLISLFLVGDTNTLPTRLWAMMRTGFSDEINALVTLILIISTILAMIVAALLRRAGAGDAPQAQS
jgi:ABC-type spermidine/putrescine transport system permease subunit II